MAHSMTSFEESAAKHVQLIDEDEEQGRGSTMRHKSFAVDAHWVQTASSGIMSRPWVAISIIFFTFLNFILAVVAISKVNSMPSSSSNTEGKTHPQGLGSHGVDCSGSEDMLFGSDVHSFEGHYYQLVGVGNKVAVGGAQLTFMDVLHDAEHRCYDGLNGQLATIESASENAFLSTLLKSDLTFQDGDRAWIGAGDMKREGTFEWITKSLRTNGVAFWKGGTAAQGGHSVDSAYTNWHDNEPNSGGEEDCVEMYGGSVGNADGGFWNDVSCYRTNAYFFVEFGS